MIIIGNKWTTIINLFLIDNQYNYMIITGKYVIPLIIRGSQDHALVGPLENQAVMNESS